jgi:hypothetical protein
MSIVVSNLKKDSQSAIVANRSYRKSQSYYPNPGTEKDNTIVNYMGGAQITPIKTAIRMDKQRRKAERFERVMGNVYSHVDNATNLRDFRAETQPKKDFVREEYNPQYDPRYAILPDADIPDSFYEANGDEDGEETKRPDSDQNPNQSKDMWDDSHRVEEIPDEKEKVEEKVEEKKWLPLDEKIFSAFDTYIKQNQVTQDTTGTLQGVPHGYRYIVDKKDGLPIEYWKEFKDNKGDVTRQYYRVAMPVISKLDRRQRKSARLYDKNGKTYNIFHPDYGLIYQVI